MAISLRALRQRLLDRVRPLVAHAEGRLLMTTQSTSRIMCQCCQRMLTPRADGTSRNHNRHENLKHQENYCPGSGFRLDRWKPRQQLRHHSGDVWEVVEDRGGRYGDYYLRCLAGREKGREMIAHGEYMHRHGWTPLPRDLMADLEESLKAVRDAA